MVHKTSSFFSKGAHRDGLFLFPYDSNSRSVQPRYDVTMHVQSHELHRGCTNAVLGNCLSFSNFGGRRIRFKVVCKCIERIGVSVDKTTKNHFLAEIMMENWKYWSING